MDAQADIDAVRDDVLKGSSTPVSDHKQGICPGCGRCRVCGQPSGHPGGYETVPLYPNGINPYPNSTLRHPNWVLCSTSSASTLNYTNTFYA